jgi:alpha(1,3/1,4) fucosyltransferase
MKNIKVDFRNFPKLNYQNDITLKFIKHFFEINNITINIDNKNPDVIFYNVNCWKDGRPCFPEKDIANSKGVKVLYTRENLYDHWYPKTYLPNLDKFDFVLGFEDNVEKNRYKIPYYFVVGKLYDESQIDYQTISKNLVENIYKKNKNISLISRNPHKLRLSLINKFKNKDVVVDCPGKVGNNMPSIDDIPFVSITHRNKHNNLKINFLSDYFFNICPENSWYPGYTTEKLYHAMISGCIPIYWGCDKLDDGFYNKEKVFFINKDLSNLDSTVDDTVKLLNNPNELLHYVGMNPFGENRLDIISDQNKKITNIFKQIVDSL